MTIDNSCLLTFDFLLYVLQHKSACVAHFHVPICPWHYIRGNTGHWYYIIDILFKYVHAPAGLLSISLWVIAALFCLRLAWSPGKTSLSRLFPMYLMQCLQVHSYDHIVPTQTIIVVTRMMQFHHGVASPGVTLQLGCDRYLGLLRSVRRGHCFIVSMTICCIPAIVAISIVYRYGSDKLFRPTCSDQT